MKTHIRITTSALTMSALILASISPLASAQDLPSNLGPLPAQPSVVAPASTTFSDVPTTHTHSDAIKYVRSVGIVKGYDDGTYKPEKQINRAEFTKIIMEAMLGQAPLVHAGQCFPDVKSGMWFYPYVCFAEQEGIISGYPDGTFKPERTISFAEASKIIANSFEMKTTPDAVWYKPFVQALAAKKAIPATITSFEKPVTRGEMAEMVYRIKKNITSKASQTFDGIKGSAPAAQPDSTLPSSMPETDLVSFTDAEPTWKVHQDTELGIAFKYPEDWYIERDQEDLKSIYVTNYAKNNEELANGKKEGSIRINIIPEDRNPLDHYTEGEGVTSEQMTINNQTVNMVTKKSGADESVYAVWTVRGNRYIAAAVGGVSEEEQKMEKEILERMIKTLGAPATTSPAVVAKTPAVPSSANTTTAPLDPNWNEFKSGLHNISLRTPRKALWAACEYEMESGKFSLRDIMTPIKVLEDEDGIYITTSSSNKVSEPTGNGANTRYKTCAETTNTVNLIKNGGPTTWAIAVKKVNGYKGLEAYLKERFSEGCTIGIKSIANQPGVINVTIDAEPGSSCPYSVDQYTIKYYPAASKAAVWTRSQSATFREQTKTYDQEIIDSLKFL